jgi:ATP-dependent phosphofructokinase / diphosphate-dependent phosphofructokinase
MLWNIRRTQELVSLIYTRVRHLNTCVIPEYKVNLDKLIQLLLEEKRTNPSNYALVVLSEGAEWEGYKLQEYDEPDAYGHRKKASVAESLADEINRRIGEGRRCGAGPVRRLAAVAVAIATV